MAHAHTEDHFDICIIGSGSDNSIVCERFDDRGIALVDRQRRIWRRPVLSGGQWHVRPVRWQFVRQQHP